MLAQADKAARSAVPSCGESPVESLEESNLRICERHRAVVGCDFDLGEWRGAREMLKPMLEMAKLLGKRSLVEVMEEALDRADRAALFWEVELGRISEELQ